MYSIQSAKDFFYNLKPIDGALEALKEMEQLGYNVYIVSSPSVRGDYCHSDKNRWLKDHLGEKWARRLILTKDKTLVHGDYLIDDKPYIHGIVSKPSWKHVTYAQSYNIDLPDKNERVYIRDWKDWKVILDK